MSDSAPAADLPCAPATDASASTRRVSLWSSLRWRLPLAMALLIVAAVALSLLGSFVLLRREFNDRAHRQLAQQMVGAASYFGTKQADLQDFAGLIQDDRTVSAALKQGDRVTLILRLRTYYARLNVDRLDVVDARGKVVVRSEDPLNSGDSIATRPSIHAALQGRQNCGVEQDPASQSSARVLRVTVPLFDPPGKLEGAVSVGRLLDSLFATEIGNAVQATLHLQIASPAASGGAAQRMPAQCLVTPPSVAAASAGIVERQEAGQSVLSGLVPLTGTDGRSGGAIEVVQPLSDVYAAITTVTVVLLIMGLVVALIGAAGGIWLSRGLTRRLSALEATAAVVACGDLSPRVPVQGKDEIASLARSLSRMIVSLRERMELTVQLRGTAEARVHELEGLAEIAQLLTSDSTLVTTLDEVAARICAIVDCPAVAIALLEEGNARRGSSHLIVRGAHGMRPDTRELLSRIISSTEFPIPDSADYAGDQTGPEPAPGPELHMFRRAMASNTIQWALVEGLQASANTSHEVALLYQACVAEGWGAATAAPMVLKGRRQGVTICFTVAPDPLPAVEQRVLRTVIGQATVAVENARLFARSHDLAVLEERTRLARDLHDSVSQMLFSLNLAARAATNPRTRESPERLERALAMVGELAQGSLAEMRALLFELRPAQLHGEGLLVALRNHAVAMEQRTGLPVRVELPEQCDLLPAYEDVLYRVSQEALVNVVRHAHAGQAIVRLRLLPEWVELSIEDDGVGIVSPESLFAAPDGAGRYGIRGMRERVVALGGRLEITSGSANAVAAGTRVCVRLPLRQHLDAQTGRRPSPDRVEDTVTPEA